MPLARWRLSGRADVVEHQVESRAHPVAKPVDVGGVLRCTGVDIAIELVAKHALIAYVSIRKLPSHDLAVCRRRRPEPLPVRADVGCQVAWDEYAVYGDLEQVAVDHEDVASHPPNLPPDATRRKSQAAKLLGSSQGGSGRRPGHPTKSSASTFWRKMAAKRPELIPIQDSVVRSVLGGWTDGGFWLAMREAMLDLDLRRSLGAIRAEAQQPQLSLLRVLDIVLWMHGKYGSS